MPLAEVTISPDLQKDAILRRYMDLPKLLDLLHSKTLYLPRADRFPDRLEGALFPAFRRQLDTAHKRGKLEFNAEYFYRRSREGNYVSCWTLGAHDNMALWQLYGGTRSSVALTTTVKKLTQLCVNWRRTAIVQKVKYVNHRKKTTYAIGCYTDVLQYKNLAYEYEAELRILIPEQGEGWEGNALGLRLPIADLNTLVRSIVIAPEANPEYKCAVEDLCRRYGLTAPVRSSALAVTKT